VLSVPLEGPVAALRRRRRRLLLSLHGGVVEIDVDVDVVVVGLVVLERGDRRDHDKTRSKTRSKNVLSKLFQAPVDLPGQDKRNRMTKRRNDAPIDPIGGGGRTNDTPITKKDPKTSCYVKVRVSSFYNDGHTISLLVLKKKFELP
jgi:hypothetical protein